MSHPKAAAEFEPAAARDAQPSRARTLEAHASPLLIAALLAASVLPIMQAGLLAPALSVIGEHFSDTPNATLLVRLTLVAPALTIVLFAPFIGALADTFGVKPLLAAGLGLYGLCGAAAALAGGIEQLLVVRTVLGFALSIISSIMAILVGAHFDGAGRDRMLGWQAAVIGLSGAIFPAVGGLLASIGWRLVFLPYALAFFLLLLVPRLFDASHPRLLRAAAVSFPYAAVLRVYSLAFAGALLLYLLPTQLAFHLHELGSSSPAVAGLALATASLAAAAASLVYPRLRRRLSFLHVAALSFCLVAVGYAVMALAAAMPMIALGLAVAGCGFGLNLPNCIAWLLSRVPEGTRGTASGGLATSMFLGQLVSPFLYDPLVAYRGSAGVFLGAALASTIVALMLATCRRQNAEPPQAPAR